MPALLLRNELTARVISGGTEALVTHDRMVIAASWVAEGASDDAYLLLVILDENGEPILDVTGQYLIGG